MFGQPQKSFKSFKFYFLLDDKRSLIDQNADPFTTSHTECLAQIV